MLEDKIRHINTAILGAGLSGLSAAFHGNGVIFEKEREIGGTCRSLRTKGYTFDPGIHVLHTKNKYILSLLSKDKNLGLKQKKRSAWIYSNRVLTKYPFQVNTFGLPKKIVKDCLTGFKNALKRPKSNYDNYEDWIYSVFGKGIADNFYIPYSEKFWTVKAQDLNTEWVGPRVPRPRLEHVIRGTTSLQKEEFGPNAEFLYPQQAGIQQITRALLKKDIRIMLCREAVSIELDKKIIFFKDHTAIRYNSLISTMPLPELFKIVNIAPDAVRQALGDLKHNSVLCVNLGIKREDVTGAHWIYFPEDKFIAFRISFPKNFSDATVPKKWSSIQAEISYSKFRPIKSRDIVERVIQDLIKAKIIRAKDQVRLINTQDIKYAYVIYDHNRLSNLKIINKFLRKYNIYNAGRYGQWEYLWMDEAILSGKNILREIIK